MNLDCKVGNEKPGIDFLVVVALKDQFQNFQFTLGNWAIPVLVVMLVFFALQIWSSRRWLTGFYMGPAEWVWRSLAYGISPPFKRHPVRPASD